MAVISLPEGEAKAGGEYLLAFCPSCGKENHFYYNVLKRVGQCKVCGYAPHDIKDWDCEDTHPFFTVSAGKCYSESIRVNAWAHDSSRMFLQSRGVTQDQVNRFHIKVDLSRECLEIPVDPTSPEFPPTVLERYYRFPDSKWYSRPGENKLNYVFNLEAMARPRVLVCEGIFDILASHMEDYALSILGTQWTRDIVTLLSYREVAVWLDPDSAGYSATLKIQDLGETYGFNVYDLTTLYNAEPKSLNPTHSRYNRLVIDQLKGWLDGTTD